MERITLTDNGKSFIVSPQSGSGFRPFVLPKIPLALIDRVTRFCTAVILRHDRCSAGLLLLECRKRVWASGIPPQTCSRESAYWQARREDFPHLPENARLAGTFQSRSFRGGEHPIDTVPFVDGIHLVMDADLGDTDIGLFARAGGTVIPISFDRIAFDEVAETLAGVMLRLKFI